MATFNTIQEFLLSQTANFSKEEQATFWRRVLFNHILNHPWVDDELIENITANIARELGVSNPFEDL